MQEMLQDFEANKEALFAVKDYFANSEHGWLVYPSISEDGTPGMLWVGEGGSDLDDHIPIDCEDTKNSVALLRRRGYVRINKWRGLLTITRWRRGGAHVGIVYSVDGSIPTPSNIWFLSELEPLEYDGWYYFKTNYNESRIPPEQTIYDMRDEFDENREAIFAVRDFFAGLEHDVLSYPIGFRESTNNRGVMYVGAARNYWEPRTYMEIECEDANMALELLILHGYMRVSKHDGFIEFNRWGRGGVGIGLVYSIDGSPPDSDFLTYLSKLESSEEDGWFYYEGNSRNWPR